MALYTALEDEKSISEIVRQVPHHKHFSDRSGVLRKGLSERMKCPPALSDLLTVAG